MKTCSTSEPGGAPATSWASRCSCACSATLGRLLTPGEFVPPAVVDFIGRQLDLDGDEVSQAIPSGTETFRAANSPQGLVGPRRSLAS